MFINIPEALDRQCYRYPSPLVDAVTEHEPGRRLVAVKNLTVGEEFFQGHFPGSPLMPGVLMLGDGVNEGGRETVALAVQRLRNIDEQGGVQSIRRGRASYIIGRQTQGA